MSKKILTREDIINLLPANRLPLVSVPLDELGGEIFVRVMSCRERAEYFRATIDITNPDNPVRRAEAEAILVAKTACDEKGELLFTNTDVHILAEKAADIIDKISSKAQEVNGLSVAAKETTLKNSEETPEGGSSCD